MPLPASPVPQAPSQPSAAGPVAPVQTSGATPPPQAPTAPTPAQLPPPISSVAAGELPALRFPPEPKNRALSPLSQFVAQNLDSIARAGVDFCELPDRQSVLFNPVKTNKEEILKKYHEGKLHEIPEVPALKIPSKKDAKKFRTVHSQPAMSPAPDGFQPGSAPTPDQPQNSANAPVPGQGDGPVGSNPPGQGDGPVGSNPPAPDGPVKVNKKLMGARVSALKNETLDGSKLPAGVPTRLSKRAI